MASFSGGTFSDISYTTASFYAKMTGGAGSPEYVYKRHVNVDIKLNGTTVQTLSIDSNETGSSTNTFECDVSGLSPGTTYTWVSQLYYWGGRWIAASGLTGSGTFTTLEVPISTGPAHIYIANRGWVEAQPYIYIANRGWVEAETYIYINNRGWVETKGV